MSYLFLLITLLAWSSFEVLTKPLMGVVDPFFLTFFRATVGGLFLLMLARKRVKFKDLLALTVVGSLNVIVSLTLLQLTVKHSNASTAATLVATNPLFVGIFAIAMGKEKYSFKKTVSLIIGLLGLLILSYGKMAGDSALGIVLGMLSSITFALYTVLMRDLTIKHGSLTANAYSMFFSGLLYGMILIFTGKMNFPSIDFSKWLVLLYASVVVTGLAYVTYFKAMEKLGPARASFAVYLKPAVASFFAFVFLHEPFGIAKIVGTGIIVCALFLR
ncbi:DMT family transporter [Pseudothermotoga thermarum]|uniref:EamA domain-containing protein n=1 Tax=Pseudothermotoga thermarum DSM 5069 TaxID=688269 RepID=F7YYR0_9THEM|nr:DMT family transporter [Pseudothermotoga thermarum]AEH51096.1 protein of unknown function DUF6 transmembrane [Pseudothermotoga thermarum DSM 5069]